LTASTKELNLIQFEEVQLDFEHKGETYSIKAEYKENSIDLSVTGIEEFLPVPKLDPEETARKSASASEGSEFFEEIAIKMSGTPVFKFLSSLESPVILGLERRSQVSPMVLDRERLIVRHGYAARRRSIRGTLGTSLIEAQQLVQEAYGRIRLFEDGKNQRLREELLLSMFDYASFESITQRQDFKGPETQRHILGRQKDIEQSLAGIFGSKDELSSTIEDFFEKLRQLFEALDQGPGDRTLEWLVNKPQIDRIIYIAELAEKHNEALTTYMEPLTRFKEAINAFYADSLKSIEIDPVGFMVVNRKIGNPASVDVLSSGERQLLIIFAHLMHERLLKHSGVFIIDEPELSLHLKWQGMFIERITALSPRTQFILATHSPEIVGDYKEKCKAIEMRAR
jgi:hypothetical protein